jgi:hypothetical protein
MARAMVSVVPPAEAPTHILMGVELTGKTDCAKDVAQTSSRAREKTRVQKAFNPNWQEEVDSRFKNFIMNFGFNFIVVDGWKVNCPQLTSNSGESVKHLH